MKCQSCSKKLKGRGAVKATSGTWPPVFCKQLPARRRRLPSSRRRGNLKQLEAAQAQHRQAVKRTVLQTPARSRKRSTARTGQGRGQGGRRGVSCSVPVYRSDDRRRHPRPPPRGRRPSSHRAGSRHQDGRPARGGPSRCTATFKTTVKLFVGGAGDEVAPAEARGRGRRGDDRGSRRGSRRGR